MHRNVNGADLDSADIRRHSVLSSDSNPAEYPIPKVGTNYLSTQAYFPCIFHPDAVGGYAESDYFMLEPWTAFNGH